MASKRFGTLGLFKPLLSPPSTPVLTLKTLQDVLQKMVQETVQLFEEQNKMLKGDILRVCQRFAFYTDRVDKTVDEVVEKKEKLEDRMAEIENNKDIIRNEITMLQYKEMEYALRIRGLKEDSQENLKEEISADLAVIWDCGHEEISREIEKIFRVNSWVAKQRNLPRDVVIYFSKRSLRNEVIQAFYKQRFQIAAQDVIILKEIPSKILRKRKDFAFLTEELKKRHMRFRWDIPVGIVVNYKGICFKLHTVLEARDFYDSVLKASSPSPPQLERRG